METNQTLSGTVVRASNMHESVLAYARGIRSVRHGRSTCLIDKNNQQTHGASLGQLGQLSSSSRWDKFNPQIGLSLKEHVVDRLHGFCTRANNWWPPQHLVHARFKHLRLRHRLVVQLRKLCCMHFGVNLSLQHAEGGIFEARVQWPKRAGI